MIVIMQKSSPYVTSSISNKVSQALVLSHPEYCMVVWYCVAKKRYKKTARLALTKPMSQRRCLSWLTVQGKFTSSLLISARKPDFVTEQLVKKSLTHNHQTR